jgi:hypothetical protein
MALLRWSAHTLCAAGSTGQRNARSRTVGRGLWPVLPRNCSLPDHGSSQKARHGLDQPPAAAGARADRSAAPTHATRDLPAAPQTASPAPPRDTPNCLAGTSPQRRFRTSVAPSPRAPENVRPGPPARLTERGQGPILRVLRRAPSACFGAGCTLTTEEWQRSRNTDVRAVKPSDEVAAARLCVLSESLILAQDQRWRRA